MNSNAYRTKIHFGNPTPSRIKISSNDTRIPKPSTSASRERGRSMGIGEERLKMIPAYDNSANTSVNTTFILNNSYITNNNNYSIDIGAGNITVKSNATPGNPTTLSTLSNYQPDSTKAKRKIATDFNSLNFYGTGFNSKKIVNVKN